MTREALVRFYRDRVWIVTGATSGNGRAVAEALLDLGARVHAIGRNPQALAALEALGAVPVRLDLGDLQAVERAVRRLGREEDRFDGLIHLAGNAPRDPLSSAEFERFRRSDLVGPIYLAEGLSQSFRPCARIALVTSASAGLDPLPGLASYQRTKLDLVDWVRRSRRKFERRGVSLVLISMGFVATPIWARSEFHPAIVGLVEALVPGPAAWTSTILSDIAEGRAVSYPGLLARAVPIVDDSPRPIRGVQALATLLGRLSTIAGSPRRS